MMMIAKRDRILGGLWGSLPGDDALFNKFADIIP
jgi:hypothetical protein